MMKQYLMDKTNELAVLLAIPYQNFYYGDQNLSNMAVCYAQYLLHKEQEEKNTTREEINKAILARTDEVVELIQRLLNTPVSCSGSAIGACPACPYSFLCEKSTQYK